MKYFMLLLACCQFTINSLAQEPAPAKYWVKFTDKNNSPFSVLKPHEFLSARALERRARSGVGIEENDLPVNPHYVAQLIEAGATIHNRSRWLNAATIIADDAMVKRIEALSFVKSITYVGKHLTSKSITAAATRDEQLEPYNPLPEYYGYGTAQISLLNGQLLHQLGFRGKGKMIAVLDGGFSNVDIMPFFDSLRAEGRLIEGFDFADNDATVYESSSHGTQVLSTMAATLPGLMVGTAPDATYVLIKTEDTRGEYLVEECNWAAGAEYADSMGVDVINSSLGYTTFNDKNMNYTYDDMNGVSSIASRAADIAFSKGILVVNSAGNSGSDPWKYIGVPADAHNVMAVGATTPQGTIARFSSRGPSADGRVKPNVAAMGQSVVVASATGYDLQISNGTSLASPILAGMAASLWSAFPDKTNAEIFDAIEESAHLFDSFDDDNGYGIPDFLKAYLILTSGNAYPDRQLNTWLLKDEELDTLEVMYFTTQAEAMELRLSKADGTLLQIIKPDISPGQLQRIEIPGFEQREHGLYILELVAGEQMQYFLIAR